MDAFEVRPLSCYKQNELLDQALKAARKSLVITIAGIQPSIVNVARMREIDLLISEGVQIEISLPRANRAPVAVTIRCRNSPAASPRAD